MALRRLIQSVMTMMALLIVTRTAQATADSNESVPPPTTTATVEPMAGEQCSIDDIVVEQSQTSPLPNGIPTYTVNALNLCTVDDGCALGDIHLSCGDYSSARLVDPKIFRRLQPGDCLLNDGRPLSPGSTVSFQYANSFSYPLTASSATCAAS